MRLASRLGGKGVSKDMVKSRAAIVLMPDLFLDHIVGFEEDLGRLVARISGTTRRGGGNILAAEQQVVVGGNAANCALACSRLGLPTVLIAQAQRNLLSFFMRGLEEAGVEARRLKPAEKSALTVALEVNESRGKANIMFSSSGYVGMFGPDSLDDEDWHTIRNAGLVGVFNWSQNREGTRLAEEVFSAAKEVGAQTYMDCGDFSNRQDSEIAELAKRVLSRAMVDYLSLNESEAKILARVLKIGSHGLSAALLLLREACNAEIEYHTATHSSLVIDGRIWSAPSFAVRALRAIGAGDAWNAGNIFGIVNRYSPMQRLLFANAVAGLYVSCRNGTHPTLRRARGFLKVARLVRMV